MAADDKLGQAEGPAGAHKGVERVAIWFAGILMEAMVLPFSVGCKIRPAGVCSGYTKSSPPGQQGQSTLIQKRRCQPGHFCGPHGFFQLGNPILT